MSTPRVFEVPLPMGVVEHDDFGDEPARAPRATPYHRPSQRELVRRSLDFEVSHEVYPNRKVKP